MSDIKIEIDFSYINLIINYLSNSTDTSIEELVNHDAAKGIYNHAIRFQNTTNNITNFWREILLNEKKKGKQLIKQMKKAKNYVKEKREDFLQAFHELEEYLPKTIQLNSKLYLMAGYDMGIVSEGNAYLNLAYPLYHKYPRELLYFSMHELHHVGFTHYQPMFSLEDIKKTTDLYDMIRYLTQLEGLAVYTSLKRRKRENGLTHEDYLVLFNENEKKDRIQSYFEILEKISELPEKTISEEDFKIIEQMSGTQRLWYIAGAEMAQKIDEKFGRDKLIQTIIDGPKSFFLLYENST